MKTGMVALGRQRLERLVIVVDVRVFAMQVNAKAAKAYASLIHSCVQRMLAACNEHSAGYKRSTLWAYKLFDSSLSPLASRSTLDGLLNKELPHLVRFSTSEGNLAMFQQALEKVAVGLCTKQFDGCQQGEGKLDFVVRALQELFSDFMWGPLFLSDNSSSDEDLGRQKRSDGPGWNPLKIRENVVILFSPLPTLMKRFANFLDTLNPWDSGVDRDLLRAFSRKLIFLQEPFRLHNIHTCWMDITSTLAVQDQELPVSSDLEQRVDRRRIHSELAEARWSFMALDTFAIASDSIPKSMLWSSIAYPAPPVLPNDSKMFAKLRIVIRDRNAVKLQPIVCRLVVVPLVSNYFDTRLMKENALNLLSDGTSFLKSIPNHSQDSQVLLSAKMKIVLKSLVPKQDLVFKIGSKRYLLYHHAGVGTIGKKESDTDSAQDQSLRECRSDYNHNTYGDEIFQQLQQQPMKFEPGEPAWQLLLIAIARKKSVAKVDLYQDGLCISAILEPITVNYAVLMQEDQGSKPASSESLMLRRQSSRAFNASGPLATINEEDENRSREHSASDECANSKQEGRPGKRSTPAITEQDGSVVKRERLACDKEGKQPCSTKYNHCFKGETYSRTKHWQFILQRGKVGTGKHQIENTYVRPGQGQRPTKVLLTLKCWLDQLHVHKEQQAAPQDMPSPSMMIEANAAAADGIRVGEEDVFVAKFDTSTTERSSSLPTEMHRLNPESVWTEEQAEAYLLSIEGMVQDCLKSEDVDIQSFAKRIVSEAQVAQQVLCKRDMQRESMQAVQNDMQGKTIDAGCMFLTVEKGTSIGRGSNTHANLNCDSQIFETEGSTKGTGEERDLAETQGISVACGYGAMQQLEIEGTLTVDNVEMHNDYNLDQSKEDLNEVVAHQLVKKLLVKPRKLARQYKDYQSSSSLVSERMTEGNHTAEEKVRASELQIVLRMELIAHDSGGPLEKQKKTLVKEICQLLDGILFHLGGGMFGDESLNDYCNRVINGRYKNFLPKTVADIFDMMEFNGYTKPVSDPQPALCSPGADMEAYCEHTTRKGENIELQGEANKLDITNQSPAAIKSSKLQSMHAQRSKSQGLTTEGIIKRRNKVPAFTNELTKANEKRKLASRLTHFGGPDSHHKFKKVTLHNQVQRKPLGVSSSTLAKLKASGRDVVLETPMVDRHLPLPETHVVPDLDDQVESLCARVVMSSGRFGFRTPARARPHQPTKRKRRLILGSHKKPVGRGLPRIALEAMRAMKARKELQRALDNGVQEPLYQSAGQFERPGFHVLNCNDDPGGILVAGALQIIPCSRKRMSPDPDSRQGQYGGGIVKEDAREVLSPLSENASRLLAQAMQKDSEALKHDVLMDNTGYKRRDTFNLSYGLSHSPVAASASEIWSPLSRECSMLVTAAQAVDTLDDIDLNICENLEIEMTRSDTRNRRKSPRTSELNEEVLPLSSSSGSEAAATATTSATPCPASTHWEPESGAHKTLEVQVANNVEDGEIVDLKTRGSVRQNRRKSLRTSKLNKMESPSSSPMGSPTDSMFGGQARPLNETQQTESTEERAATEGEVLESTQTVDRSSRRKSGEQPSINASVDIFASRGLCQSASPELERSSLPVKGQKDSHWKICRTLQVCSKGTPITSFIRRPDGDAHHADLKDSRIVLSQDLETTEKVNRSGKKRIQQQPTRTDTSDRSKSPTSLGVSISGRLQVVASASILTAHQNSQDDILGASEHNRKDSPLIFPTVVNKILQQPLCQATLESDDDLALLELCSSGSPEPRLKPEARLSTSYHRAHKRKKVGLVPEDGELQGGMLEDGGKENCSPMLERKTRRAREEGIA